MLQQDDKTLGHINNLVVSEGYCRDSIPNEVSIFGLQEGFLASSYNSDSSYSSYSFIVS